MSISLDQNNSHDFDIFGSIFEGKIRLFKLSDSSAAYNQHFGPLIKDEVVKKVVDEHNVMACIMFEPQINLLDVLKKVFPTKESLKTVTHVRCLKQSLFHSNVKDSSLLLNEFDEEQGYHNNLLLVNFTTAENKQQFSLEFDGYEIQQTLLKVINIKEVVFTAKLFQSLPMGHKREISMKKEYNKNSSYQNQPVLPYLIEDPFTKEHNSSVSNIELPTCPVCLDRLDSATTGIITTNCQHAFHCKCLMKWKNSRCPVCRYTLDQTNQNEKKCSQCDAKTNLWCCLICGHVGCSRYSSKHAIDHYRDSGHCFSVDLNTSRVWDYAEDKYVHRLVQNFTDGKLVEISGSSGSTQNQRDRAGGESAKKEISNDEDNLEYIQLLLSQLESQQTYYENKLTAIKQERETDLDKVSEKWEQKFKSLEQKTFASEVQFKKLQESIEVGKQTNINLLATLKDMKDEIKTLKTHNEKLEREKLEQEENTKDLMFHLEAMSKLNHLDGPLTSDDPASNLAGHIVIREASDTKMSTLEAKKRKNKKKNEKKKLKKLQLQGQVEDPVHEEHRDV
ncbi:hypothetical protein ACO0QE_000123 [Hanseniaspora vineae]